MVRELLPTEVEGADRLGEMLDAIHGADAPTRGNGEYRGEPVESPTVKRELAFYAGRTPIAHVDQRDGMAWLTINNPVYPGHTSDAPEVIVYLPRGQAGRRHIAQLIAELQAAADGLIDALDAPAPRRRQSAADRDLERHGITAPEF